MKISELQCVKTVRQNASKWFCTDAQKWPFSGFCFLMEKVLTPLIHNELASFWPFLASKALKKF